MSAKGASKACSVARLLMMTKFPNCCLDTITLQPQTTDQARHVSSSVLEEDRRIPKLVSPPPSSPRPSPSPEASNSDVPKFEVKRRSVTMYAHSPSKSWSYPGGTVTIPHPYIWTNNAVDTELPPPAKRFLQGGNPGFDSLKARLPYPRRMQTPPSRRGFLQK